MILTDKKALKKWVKAQKVFKAMQLLAIKPAMFVFTLPTTPNISVMSMINKLILDI